MWMKPDRKLREKKKEYFRQAEKQNDKIRKRKFKQLGMWLDELERRRKNDCHYMMLAVATSIIMAIALIIKFIF